MKLMVLSVHDAKAASFGQPFYAQSLGQAERSFSDEINRPDQSNPLYNHSGDFILYCLGSWNDEDGSFDQNVPPLLVASGNSLRRS